jgi:hypothetical protein
METSMIMSNIQRIIQVRETDNTALSMESLPVLSHQTCYPLNPSSPK